MERVAGRLAWLIAILSATLTAAGLILLGLTFDRPYLEPWGFRGFAAIFAIETAILGALLMSRRPDNVIGWLFAFIGLTNSIQLFASEYVIAATGGSLPGSEWTAWLGAFVWVPTVVVGVGLVPLLFPDGRLLSRRWRPVLWLLIIGAGLTVAVIALQPSVRGATTIPYPYEPPLDPALANAAWSLGYGAIAAGIVGAFASSWQRWRRATGVTREQLKWLAWAGGLVVVSIPLSLLPWRIGQVVFIGAVALVPLAVGIAILRYRLYDIDTVISRTLVYGLLTAILAGLFAGVQRILQGLFVSVTGNESDAAWAITALVLAAVFAPLKGVLERFVAGRFRDPAARSAAVPVPAPIDPAATAGAGMAPDDLEAMLRRIVREELAMAMNRTSDDG